MSIEFYRYLLLSWIILSPVIFLVLLKVTAPYGRHTRTGWGFTISNTGGWVLMEIVSPAVFAFFFLRGDNHGTANWVLFFLWMMHYVNRSLIYPFRIHDANKKMPLIICLSAIFFNSVNGYLNGYWLGTFKLYDESWLSDWRFILGGALFVAGYVINFSSDQILLNLRKNRTDGAYKIPVGGFYKWISCPNYFGEIVEWFGWALATWSLPGLSFALWTAANLIPRALSNHKWYKTTFPDYPAERKAMIPFVV